MIGRLRILDDYLIRLTQEAYLWLWDRTGVYVASLIYIAVVVDHICWGPLKAIDFILLALMGAWAGFRYVAQEKDLRRLNDLQRLWSDFFLRRPMMVFAGTWLAVDGFQLNAWHMASDTCFIAWNYLACVQVRDREPRDFLSFRKTVGAGT